MQEHNMESMVSKTFLKVIRFAASLMLTLFSGLFALVSLSCLFASIIERDVISVVGCVATGFIAWVMWNVRRDVL